MFPPWLRLLRDKSHRENSRRGAASHIPGVTREPELVTSLLGRSETWLSTGSSSGTERFQGQGAAGL